MRRIVIISGFAQSDAALQLLADSLREHSEVTLTSVSRLLAMHSPQTSDSRARAMGQPSEYALALLQLLRASGKSTIIGWSMGGMVGLEVASLAPELVTSLVLCGSTPCFIQKPEGQYFAGQTVEQLRAFKLGLSSKPEFAITKFLSAVYQGNTVTQEFLSDRVHAAMMLAPTSLSHSLEYLLFTDLRLQLPEIQPKTLLLHGENDSIVSPKASLHLANALCCDKRLKIIDQSGHGVFDIAPELLLHDIRSFLDE